MERYLSATQLEAGLDLSGTSPKDEGRLEMIVCRPKIDERQVLNEAQLDTQMGLVGDNWSLREPAMREAQITIMNSRIIQLVAQDRSLWPLAGDQLFVDLDLSIDNLPPGQQIALGTAILEVSALPHTGCSKFTERFGIDANRFVNSPEGRQMRRRGLNAKVVQPGVIRVGDIAKKI